MVPNIGQIELDTGAFRTKLYWKIGKYQLSKMVKSVRLIGKFKLFINFV